MARLAARELAAELDGERDALGFLRSFNDICSSIDVARTKGEQVVQEAINRGLPADKTTLLCVLGMIGAFGLTSTGTTSANTYATPATASTSNWASTVWDSDSGTWMSSAGISLGVCF
jgi:hypothetical protein